MGTNVIQILEFQKVQKCDSLDSLDNVNFAGGRGSRICITFVPLTSMGTEVIQMLGFQKVKKNEPPQGFLPLTPDPGISEKKWIIRKKKRNRGGQG